MWKYNLTWLLIIVGAYFVGLYYYFKRGGMPDQNDVKPCSCSFHTMEYCGCRDEELDA